MISLVRPKPNNTELEPIHTFLPDFTYPIYGQDEVIFGYKKLKIRTRFAAHNLLPNIEITYDKKFKQLGDAKATDIVGILKKFLPEASFKSNYDESVIADTSAREWKPPGTLVSQYERNGRKFEVWAGSLLDRRVRTLLENIQIMVLYYIEGGQPLPLDEEPDWSLERWKVYYIYEKTRVVDAPNISPYVLCGYTTTYRFHRFVSPSSRPKTTTITTISALGEIKQDQEPCRVRISQFVIFPPFQHAGHGSALYKLIYREVIKDPAVLELTVEDPSEEFDRLRDINDFATLEPQLREAGVKLNIDLYQDKARLDVAPIKKMLPHDTLKAIRVKNKIVPRQFSRMVEMFLYSTIPESHRDPIGANTNSNTRLMVRKHRTENIHDRTYYWWRVLMRHRIFKQNEDVLTALCNDEERLKIISDTARGQQDEYEGMLAKMAEKILREAQASMNIGRHVSGGKRKVIVDDDDDDDDDAGSSASFSKRSRMD